MSDDTNTTQNDAAPEAPKTPERPQRPARRADGDEAVVRPVIRMLGKATGRGGGRRKVCRFCAEPNTAIDYKNPQILKNFITDRGKITPRRISGNCAKHQRRLELAIRRARMIALMPFTVTGR